MLKFFRAAIGRKRRAVRREPFNTSLVVRPVSDAELSVGLMGWPARVQLSGVPVPTTVRGMRTSIGAASGGTAQPPSALPAAGPLTGFVSGFSNGVAHAH